MDYENLLNEITDKNIQIMEFEFQGQAKGYYHNNCIALNTKIDTVVEKKCIMAEELGHHETSFGNITDQSNIKNKKQEILANKWACRKLVDLIDIIMAYKKGCRNCYEIAEYLEVTEDFFEKSILFLKQKYGLFHKVENYLIYFEPNLLMVEAF